jgi:transcriptional regulator with XRE-family HTH domain
MLIRGGNMSDFFANNLKFLREQYGLSKSQLAERAKVSQSTITRWEEGEMGITIDNVYELSKILNIPLPDLIGTDLRKDDNNGNRPLWNEYKGVQFKFKDNRTINDLSDDMKELFESTLNMVTKELDKLEDNE